MSDEEYEVDEVEELKKAVVRKNALIADMIEREQQQQLEGVAEPHALLSQLQDRESTINRLTAERADYARQLEELQDTSGKMEAQLAQAEHRVHLSVLAMRECHRVVGNIAVTATEEGDAADKLIRIANEAIYFLEPFTGPVEPTQAEEQQALAPAAG